MRKQSKKLENKIMNVLSKLSSLGIQKTCQRKAQLKAQASQSSAKWHLEKQPVHPSGIVTEMLMTEAGAVEMCDLIEDIISQGCIPIH